jgi:hypothetical protein
LESSVVGFCDLLGDEDGDADDDDDDDDDDASVVLVFADRVVAEVCGFADELDTCRVEFLLAVPVAADLAFGGAVLLAMRRLFLSGALGRWISNRSISSCNILTVFSISLLVIACWSTDQTVGISCEGDNVCVCVFSTYFLLRWPKEQRAPYRSNRACCESVVHLQH